MKKVACFRKKNLTRYEKFRNLLPIKTFFEILMRRNSVLIVFRSLVFVALFAVPTLAATTLDLQLAASSNLQVFFLEDLNISGEAPSSVVFQATINHYPSQTEAYFVFTMNNAQSEILRGQSDAFPLSAGRLQVTNLDLTADGSPYQLKDYEVGSEADYIEEKLLQTGYFPSDTYNLRLELRSEPGEVLLAADEVSVILTNPFDIRLVSPDGTPGNPTQMTTTTPLLTWLSSANQFLLKVCEKTVEGSDPESVMMSRPHYETEPSAPLTAQSFLYPASGVRSLEPGHTYYWQVTSLVQTSGGIQEYPSQIGAFTLQMQMDPEAQMVVMTLQRILGSEYQNMMGQLSGFQPTGDIRLDGSPMTTTEFDEIAKQFEQGHYHITSVSME